MQPQRLHSSWLCKDFRVFYQRGQVCANHRPRFLSGVHSTFKPAMARDYSAAIEALNTLQSNFAIVDAIRKSGKGMNQNAIPEMRDWCKKVGYEPSELNKLNAIHIAGTKGKGSTSAFISSILCQYLPSGQDNAGSNGIGNAGQHVTPHRVGLYTSPHLRSVRERIRINDEPLSEELFAKYFFEVWDRLERYAQEHPAQNEDGTPAPNKPVYFRYLTLMAFHAYVCENVDTAVIECGIGGEYDSTNILEAPTVAAVTNLGIDHTSVLGDTIEDIAWHKAGVFKAASKSHQAFTVDSQPTSAVSVLRKRAEENGIRLQTVSVHPEIQSDKVKLGLAADFQKTNASLAVAVAATHLRTLGMHHDIPDPLSPSYQNTPLPAAFRRGLELVQWGGRCEIRRQGNVAWHLDGGHTMESIRLAAEWFAGCISDTRGGGKRVLLFNQQTRDAGALARALHEGLAEALHPVPDAHGKREALFTHAIFSTNMTFAADDAANGTAGAGADGKPGRYKADLVSINSSAADVSQLTVQKGLAQTWAELETEGVDVTVEGTVEGAVRKVRSIAAGVDEGEEVVVLATGSLHLVGAVLEVLEELKP